MRLEWQLAAMIGVLIWQTAGRSVPPSRENYRRVHQKIDFHSRKDDHQFQDVHEIIMIARVTVDMQSNMIHALAPRAGRAEGLA